MNQRQEDLEYRTNVSERNLNDVEKWLLDMLLDCEDMIENVRRLYVEYMEDDVGGVDLFITDIDRIVGDFAVSDGSLNKSGKEYCNIPDVSDHLLRHLIKYDDLFILYRL
jgi:hypothetical protein